jgi:hypothetical protein
MKVGSEDNIAEYFIHPAIPFREEVIILYFLMDKF